MPQTKEQKRDGAIRRLEVQLANASHKHVFYSTAYYLRQMEYLQTEINRLKLL